MMQTQFLFFKPFSRKFFNIICMSSGFLGVAGSESNENFEEELGFFFLMIRVVSCNTSFFLRLDSEKTSQKNV